MNMSIPIFSPVRSQNFAFWSYVKGTVSAVPMHTILSMNFFPIRSPSQPMPVRNKCRISLLSLGQVGLCPCHSSLA